MVDWVKAKAFLSKHARKPLSATHKSEIEKMLRTGPPTYADLVRILPELAGPEVEAYFVYPEELRTSKRIAVFRDFLLRKVAEGRNS